MAGEKERVEGYLGTVGGSKEVMIDYTNHRGERALRRIVPMRLVFESNEWHPEIQWLLEAVDVDRAKSRTFALVNIHQWYVHHKFNPA